MIHTGDCREWLATLPDASVRCCVTSPPYFGLRDYGHDGQIGLEPTPVEYVAKLVTVFAEVRRVLTDDGTLWLNLGDTYNAYNGGAGPSSKLSKGAQTTARPALARGFGLLAKSLKPKDILGIPWRVAFALQDDGWFLRQDIIWAKPNPMPESVRDRCTKSHEYLFLLAKSRRYYFDHSSMQEPATYAGQGRGGSKRRYSQNAAGMDSKQYDTRNRRSVWTIKPSVYRGAGRKHFATFPEELVEQCILAGSEPGDTVIDPFAGSGTTLAVAMKHGRRAMGAELSESYCEIIRKRLKSVTPRLMEEGKSHGKP